MRMQRAGRWTGVLVLGVVLVLGGGAGAGGRGPGAPIPAQVRTAFGADCETLVVQALYRAEREVRVAIYSLTRPSIVEALVAAAERGVSVELKYDAEQYDYDGMKKAIGVLKKKGIVCTAIRMRDEQAHMHHKFAVIDRRYVLTGSFNFTTAGTVINRENLVEIDSPAAATAFLAEYGRVRTAR